MVWCADNRLCGACVWGPIEEGDVRILVGLMGISAHLAPSFQVLTDIRLVEKVNPAAFVLYAELLVNRVRQLGGRVGPSRGGEARAGWSARRPRGCTCSSVACPSRCSSSPTLEAALGWLGGAERVALGREIVEHVAAARRPGHRRAAATA